MDKYDIVLLAGQSNAEGCGIGEVAEPYVPTSRIMQMDTYKTVEHSPEQAVVTYCGEPILSIAREYESPNGSLGNFALAFATRYVESGLLEVDRKLLILRCAVGGTGFWKKHWGLRDGVYLQMVKMLEYARCLHNENRVVACLWHQGEHDAFEHHPAEQYEQQLRDLIADLRKKSGEPYLPFIAGDFVADWKGKNQESCDPIVQTIERVTDMVGCAAFVKTDDLLSNDQVNGNGDDIHFCRAALYELGKRYFEAYCSIVGF